MFILANSGDVLVMSEMVGAYQNQSTNLTLSSRISHRLPKTASTTELLMEISLVNSHAILTNM